jgi:hypothetical protein
MEGIHIWTRFLHGIKHIHFCAIVFVKAKTVTIDSLCEFLLIYFVGFSGTYYLVTHSSSDMNCYHNPGVYWTEKCLSGTLCLAVLLNLVQTRK